MAIPPTDVLPKRTQELESVYKWVTAREKVIDEFLRTQQYQSTTEEDFVLVAVRALTDAELTQSPNAALQIAILELQLRYRGAGWDEAKVDPSTGTLYLKRFQRHLFVTIHGSSNDYRVPVFETESYEQAARRILADGFKYGMKGVEPGLLVVNPASIAYVRIPTHLT